jgi:hypothetical protein
MTRNLIFGLLLTTFNLFAQTEPVITVSLLANDKIADVNIDQDKYIKRVGELLDLMKKEFKGIPQDQKIAVLVVSHKVGKPTIEFYSKPKIIADKEQHFLKEVNSMNFENTKLVDFPILLNVNVKDGIVNNEFKEIILPVEKTKKEYENASLKRKYELNKIWATNEVLPVLSAYQTIVDDKFLGVKSFGTLISKTNFSESQNTSILTSKNADYWRANLEMEIGNQLIPATKIFTHISRGEFDYAMKYLEIVRMFSDPKSTTDIYLNELNWRLRVFNQQLSSDIGKGISEHDKGNYQKAISTYNNILLDYPNSAWALYEIYYSQNTLDVKNDKMKTEDRTSWDNSKIKIYQCNPLYNMDVRANNAKEGYLLFRRQEISELFKSKDEKLNDIYKYADISMDLEIYDFAAQLFWYSFTFSKDNNKALNRFLYCLEKLGVSNLKQNFKGDFTKEFEKIEIDKTKEMKKSAMYKSFKE